MRGHAAWTGGGGVSVGSDSKLMVGVHVKVGQVEAGVDTTGLGWRWSPP